MPPFRVYDNGGKTLDRYTVLIQRGRLDDVYNISARPFGVLGINQYSHSQPAGAIPKGEKLLKEKDIPEDVMQVIRARLE